MNFVQCRIASDQEDWAEAREHGEAALTALQSAGDAGGEARTLVELANIQINAQGNPAEAEGYLTSALKLADAGLELDFRARIHIALANLYANRIGDVDRAAQHIEAVEAMQDSIADPHVRRSLLFLRAWFALLQRADFPAAETWFTQALAHARRIHSTVSHTAAKFGLAHVAYFEGKIEEARSAFERCVVETDAEEILGHALASKTSPVSSKSWPKSTTRGDRPAWPHVPFTPMSWKGSVVSCNEIGSAARRRSRRRFASSRHAESRRMPPSRRFSIGSMASL